MKKSTTFLTWAAILSGIMSLISLGYNTVQYFNIPGWFNSPEIFAKLIFYGLLFIFFSHVLIILSVVFRLRKESSTYISGVLLLILGSVSFITLFFHWGALTDILKEFPAGFGIYEELSFILFAQILHFAFITYSLVFFFKLRKISNDGISKDSLIGEQLFVSLNIIGIVCGITGLSIVLVDFLFRLNPQTYKWAIIPYSLFVLIPYLLVLMGWIFQAMKDKKSGWYDEKQKFDIYKSSTITLLSSMPIMFLVFIFNYNSISGMGNILWLPLYLFAVLFIFSVTSLYNFKSY